MDDEFNLKAKINVDKLVGKEIFTGKHTHDDAFFLLGDRIYNDIIPEEAPVFDIVRILKNLRES